MTRAFAGSPRAFPKFGVVAAALVVALLPGCFSERPSPTATLPEECAELAQAAGVPASHVVVGIRGFAFHPTDVRVPAGATVTWVNCEPPGTPGGQHTATADGGAWTTPLLDRGEVASRTFPSQGSHPYHCQPHQFMQATLVVE